MIFCHYLQKNTRIIGITVWIIANCWLATGCSTANNSSTVVNPYPTIVGRAFINGMPQQSLAELEDAAAKGNSEAANALGYLYATGTSVKQDYRLALQWYHTAASAGNASANYNLGLIYTYGLGTEIDSTKAKYYLNQAESLGFPTHED
jgi:TPR repeat protein